MEIRLATVQDITHVAHLIEQTWRTPAREDLIAAVVAQTNAPIWVAKNKVGLTGFCSSFITRAADGTPRWEIDLLAVATDARGQGLGRNLVAHAVQSGRQRGAALYRALIAVNNAASERCFEVNGFGAMSKCDLWVGAPEAVEMRRPSLPDGVHLIPVETLTYRGIWVEGRYDVPTFEAAKQMALADRRDTVGAVIPAGMAHDAAQLQFAHVDTYHWWVLNA